ncbi:unnamed protein product, partial [Phaeothamnion confervicola]
GWRRRRHGRSSAGVLQLGWHAAGRGAHVNARSSRRRGAPGPRQGDLRGQGAVRLQHRAQYGARGRLVQRGTGHDVRPRMRPSAEVQHQPLPDGRRDAGPHAHAGSRRAR